MILNKLAMSDLIVLLFEIRKFIEGYRLNEINDPIHVCSRSMSVKVQRMLDH